MNTRHRRPLQTLSVTGHNDRPTQSFYKRAPSSAVSVSGNNEAEANAGAPEITTKADGWRGISMVGPVDSRKARRAFAHLRQNE